MVFRHFAWFNIESGAWIGEWTGKVPASGLMPGVIGEQRVLYLNAWLQEVQRYITPRGSVWETIAQEWDVAAYDECEDGQAVCVDVTRFKHPVGDCRWRMWNTHDLFLDWGEEHVFLQLDTTTMRIDANQQSARPLRSTPQKQILDITGTPLAQFHGSIFGEVQQKHGDWVLAPTDTTEVIRPALESVRIDLNLATPSVLEAELV